jgi:hypothetical protein
MTGGQIAALIFALVLLLPGGCFAVFGIGFLTDNDSFGGLLLVVGIVILSVVGVLFRFALRRRQPPSGDKFP